MKVADENDPGSGTPVRKRKGSDEVPVQEKRSRLTTDKVREVSAAGKTIAEVGGRVAAIELENFMCHANLKVDFDVTKNNCFYIGGPNGSGKSALFAAMNIGLGGRGNHNDRGNSVKGYIKEGETRAKIRITLMNRGEGSNPLYGDLVMIERTITHTTSTYSFKSVTGTGANRKFVPISTKKSDIDTLLARFGIELNNPIYWMSQDRSRYFLQKMEPKKLFEIFMKATELESTQESYNMCEQIRVATNETLNDLKVALREQKAEIDKWKDDKNRVKKEMQAMKNLAMLNWFSHWAPVRDAEEKLEDWEKVREKQEKILRRIEQDQSNIDKEAQEYREQMEDMNKQMKDHLHIMRQYKNAEDDAQNEYNDLRSKQDINEEALRKNEGSRKINEKLIQDARKKIDEAIHRSETNADFKELKICRQREEELKDKEDAMINIRRRCDEDDQKLSRDKSEAEQEQRRLTYTYREYADKLDYRNREIQQLEQIEKDNMTRFGPNVPKIMKMLKDNAHHFERQPKGPIGMYLNVKDKKWCLAIEEALKHQLMGFIFNSRKDELVFSRLLQQARIQQPNTSITKFDKAPYNVRDNEPSDNWNTILRSLEISDNDVSNFLIDVTQIESYLLFKSDDEARHIMNGSCPAKCFRGQTATGALVYGSVGNKGQYRIYPGKTHSAIMLNSRSGPFDKTAFAREIENLSKNVEVAKAKLQEATSGLGNLERKLERVRAEKNSAEVKLNETKANIRNVRFQIEKIEARDDEGTVGNQRAAIAEMEQTLKTLAEDKVPVLEKVKQMQVALEAKEAELNELNREKQDYFMEQQQTQDAIEGLKMKVDKFARDKEKLEQAHREVKEMQRIHKEKKYHLIEEKKDKDNKAENYEGDIPDGYDNKPNFAQIPATDVLADMCRKKSNEVKALKGQMTVLMTIEQMLVKKEAYIQAKKLFEDLTKVVRQLEECIRIRVERYPVIRHAITMRLKVAFSNLIKFRFAGGLKVDYDKKGIYLEVNPHSKQVGGGIKDLKGLSGGERSYTTACFVMALWDIMEAPFRCMDEFDVFMDAISRKIVMDLLVKLATEKYPHHQFLFFTPQGINELGEKTRVQIFEMPKVRP